MTTAPFRSLITAPGNAPPWMRTGTGERFLYPFGACVDARLEKVRQGTNAHIPIRRYPLDRSVIIGTPQADALAAIGEDRQIPRGLTESDRSYAFRLQRAFDAWRFAGTARGVLSQLLGYLLALTPAVRFVASRFDRATFPPTRLSSKWDTYPAGRAPTAEPVTVAATAGGDGDWDWDSTSPITGSWGSWSGYVIVYAVAPNAWCAPAQAWGAGSTYTPAASGYYSDVVAHEYALAGSYVGTSQAWGAGSTYTPSADGYYSTVSGGAYVAAGSYSGASQAWGVSVTSLVGESMVRIVRQFKHAGTWMRSIVVAFDGALFDPTAPSGGGVNPDGTWGQWSAVSAGAYAESRATGAVYGGEVV